MPGSPTWHFRAYSLDPQEGPRAPSAEAWAKAVSAPPVSEFETTELDHRAQGDAGATHFAWIVTRTLDVSAGDYEVEAASDDGIRVIIDGKLFVVTDTNHNTPGNLRAKVQFKLRDVLKGTIQDKRVGATDDLAAGRSTFLTEMIEVARILTQATPRSLVILDEVGRGTSTYDGMSLAWAVVEDLHDRVGARTLFATHYHELTELASQLARCANLQVMVREEGQDIVFLHRVAEGAAASSYGIHVARLAGIPGGVVARARQVLADLERSRPLGPRGHSAQMALPLPVAAAAHPVVDELERLDLDGLSPLAALNKLAEWRSRVAQAEGVE